MKWLVKVVVSVLVLALATLVSMIVLMVWCGSLMHKETASCPLTVPKQCTVSRQRIYFHNKIVAI